MYAILNEDYQTLFFMQWIASIMHDRLNHITFCYITNSLLLNAQNECKVIMDIKRKMLYILFPDVRITEHKLKQVKCNELFLCTYPCL